MSIPYLNLETPSNPLPLPRLEDILPQTWAATPDVIYFDPVCEITATAKLHAFSLQKQRERGDDQNWLQTDPNIVICLGASGEELMTAIGGQGGQVEYRCAGCDQPIGYASLVAPRIFQYLDDDHELLGFAMCSHQWLWMWDSDLQPRAMRHSPTGEISATTLALWDAFDLFHCECVVRQPSRGIWSGILPG